MASPLPLYLPEQLRELEARGIAACDGDGFALMARAGQAAWREVLATWPQAQRIVVVCGPGNNGGDGYELCRYAHQSGRDARVLRIDAHRPRSALAQRRRTTRVLFIAVFPAAYSIWRIWFSSFS